MKLYQYDDLKKVNQALGSFKRNKVLVEEVKLAVVEGKVQFFVVADPPLIQKPKEDDKPKKKKTDVTPKVEVKPVEEKEEKVEKKKKEETGTEKKKK